MHGYRGKKYAGGINRKRRWKNTEYKGMMHTDTVRSQ
jgi:hypothetical protein